MTPFIIGTLIGCIFILIISAIAAVKFEKIANMKGHSGYFWWCFWLGIIGWAMVIALPDRKMERPNYSESLTKPVTEQRVSVVDDDTLPEL